MAAFKIKKSSLASWFLVKSSTKALTDAKLVRSTIRTSAALEVVSVSISERSLSMAKKDQGS